MADNLPIGFPVPGESTIATYSYTDIADGTGVAEFYGFAVTTSASTTYGLSGNSMNANPTYTMAAAAANAVPQKTIEKDFSVIFNTPRNLKGTIYLDIPVGDNNNVLNNATYYVIATITKISGGVSSAVGAAVQSENISSGAATTNRNRIVMPIVVSSIIHFKKGDTLNVNLQLWTNLPLAAGTLDVYLFHDPEATASLVDNVSTEMILYIPFVLNI